MGNKRIEASQEGDSISRQAAIDAFRQELVFDYEEQCTTFTGIKKILEALPSVQPEIIRCKDCRWWDKYGDYDSGYCMAAKHGYWSEHWDISIRRTYKGDFYCADAERRTDETD